MKNVSDKELIDKIRGEVLKFKGASSYYDSPETKELYRRREEDKKEIDRLTAENERQELLITSLRQIIKETTERAEKAETFLKDALPNIECSNTDQSALITAIGNYLNRED